jgi:hypothetical protein
MRIKQVHIIIEGSKALVTRGRKPMKILTALVMPAISLRIHP